MTVVLTLNDVSKTYGGKPAVSGIDLAIAGDSYVSVLGASGSGKTTLLRLIAGFEEPETGSIVFEGERIDGTPAHERGIGFVFQNFALFPHLDVAGNIAFGLVNRRRDPVRDKAELDRRVAEVIRLVGLTGLERRGVSQISGGQRQRVALARTLVTRPRLVLLDEPLGALDAHLRARMRDELRQIRRSLGVTFLHVTGSETEALTMGDRLIVLDDGRIGQFAAPATVYAAPASPAVARYLNAYNLIRGSRSGASFVSALGPLPLAASGDARSASSNPPPSAPSGTSSNLGPAAADGVYAIRHDRIEVRAPESVPGADEIMVPARFVASEYGGASMLSFFALDTGQIVEVEEHLSRGMPLSLVPNSRYGLAWKRDAAIVYA
ncbi:ABC transporter ATP-binding protein [Jiella sonneratiae]|uniref:ABC transporter ATP-binding protein n=1 Tax=Jiella sonneratiae TaxID=2816856 RepID=A0ABS3IZJ2_9HYPH|nr:ABC transporter ATP-binding protein [Jiella sonneratiae]MBO0902839.1 ABC transporter ATP-binding protein [Jiella sonneratiae]